MSALLVPLRAYRNLLDTMMEATANDRDGFARHDRGGLMGVDAKSDEENGARSPSNFALCESNR